MDNDSTSMMPSSGYCPYCSGPGGYTLHSGRCPEVKAKEYHPNGRVKRIEFVEPSSIRIAGLHQGGVKAAPDFDAPMELIDSTKWAREVVIEEPMLLGPGKYTIILGELFRVTDDMPPELIVDNLLNREEESEDAILVASGVLQRSVDRALRELPSPDWERELEEL